MRGWLGWAFLVPQGRVADEAAARYQHCLLYTSPECGGTLHSHGARTVGVVSTPHLGIPTRLEIGFPRMRCPECGYVWRPAIGGVDAGHRMTEAAYADIAQRSLRLTFREVAEECV